MARFVTLASSSSGNCIYVGSAESGILIDAGISNKQICDRLNSYGISPESVSAVFVTHEHSDHIQGLRVFAEKHNVTVYATGGTLSALMTSGKLTENIKTEKLHGETVRVGEDILVDYYRTSHDAKECCGYIITLPDRKIGICTDNGKMTDEVFNLLAECDLCLLESNYDEDMLVNGPYDPALKNRILSERGHMSNDMCATTALRLLCVGRCRYLILGHISPHNNTPDLAYHCTNAALKHAGFADAEDYILKVAPMGPMDRMITF